MTIAIFIFAYLCWIADIFDVVQCKASNILISSVLITLLSWQVSTAWGIVMLVPNTVFAKAAMNICAKLKVSASRLRQYLTVSGYFKTDPNNSNISSIDQSFFTNL